MHKFVQSKPGKQSRNREIFNDFTSIINPIRVSIWLNSVRSPIAFFARSVRLRRHEDCAFNILANTRLLDATPTVLGDD